MNSCYCNRGWTGADCSIFDNSSIYTTPYPPEPGSPYPHPMGKTTAAAPTSAWNIVQGRNIQYGELERSAVAEQQHFYIGNVDLLVLIELIHIQICVQSLWYIYCLFVLSLVQGFI